MMLKGIGRRIERMYAMLPLSELLQDMYDTDSPDLILTAGSPPKRRTSGVFVPVPDTESLTPNDMEAYLPQVLNEKQIATFKEDFEFDTAFSIDGLSRFRLNVYYQRGSVGMAIRMIPFTIPPVDSLGLPPLVKSFSEKPNGLVLVTGPTGSGKSTTLAAMLDHINQTTQCHIVTIEDPIEFLHTNRNCVVDQREIGSDTKSFPAALRHVLRQAPDVIMIGEMRDLDTVSAALTLAETGHLILATLHTQSAVNAVSRIVDVFPPEQQQQVRVQLSEVLVGICVQKLLPRADKPGLVLGAEVACATPAVRSLVRDENTHQLYSVIQTSAKAGMITMNKSLSELVFDGKITKEMAMLHSNAPDELEKMLP
jgi:twitching motility protein PilT